MYVQWTMFSLHEDPNDVLPDQTYELAAMPVCNAEALERAPTIDMERMTADVNKIVCAIARIHVHVCFGHVSNEVLGHDWSSRRPKIF